MWGVRAIRVHMGFMCACGGVICVHMGVVCGGVGATRVYMGSYMCV